MTDKMRLFRQIVEKLCVIITVVLVYENALVFYQYLFPYWWSHGCYQRFFFHLIVGHWLLINTAMHYYFATSSSPGFVADLKKDVPAEEQLSYTLCPKCGVRKPPRAHHCKVCRKCVVRYDHHCPWINNCVGYRNHLHFILFCIYMTLISGYATLTGQRQFQLVIFHDQKLFRLFDPIFQPENITLTIIEHGTVGPITGVLTLFLFIINLAAMGLVFSLTVWQMSLISKGQTCVEEKIDKSVIPNTQQGQPRKRTYDYGWQHNWKAFLEVNTIPEALVRLIVPTPFQPKQDGTYWKPKLDE